MFINLKLLHLLILMKEFSNIINLKLNDFCRHEIDEKCIGKYRIPCKKSLCARKMIQCEKLNLIPKIFDQHTEAIPNTNQKDLEIFERKIPKCEKLDQIIKNSVCLNSLDCFETKKLVLNGKTIRIEKNTFNCKCQGFYGFQCNKSVCTNNSVLCELILELDVTKLDNAKSCKNSKSHTVIQTLSSRTRF